MRFIVFKFLLALSRPLIIVLLLLALTAFQLRRQKLTLAKKLLIASLSLLFLFSSPACNDFLMAHLENQFPSLNLSEVPTADAIVVLGGTMAPLTPPRIQPEESKGSRVATAARLFLRKKAPLLIVTSGDPYASIDGQLRTESSDMKEYLMTFQIPEAQIIQESRARNTEENAFFTLEIIKKRNLKKIILITSAYHMPRAMRWFRQPHLEVIAFPTDFRTDNRVRPERFLPSSDGINDFTLAIKEYLGILTFNLFH